MALFSLKKWFNLITSPQSSLSPSRLQIVGAIVRMRALDLWPKWNGAWNRWCESLGGGSMARVWVARDEACETKPNTNDPRLNINEASGDRRWRWHTVKGCLTSSLAVPIHPLAPATPLPRRCIMCVCKVQERKRTYVINGAWCVACYRCQRAPASCRTSSTCTSWYLRRSSWATASTTLTSAAPSASSAS